MPKLSFRALDAEQQRLVGDYQPVSRALTGYEIAYRSWRSGHLSASGLRDQARVFALVISHSLGRVRGDPATGVDKRAKGLLLAALKARYLALAFEPGSSSYRREWNRSVVNARRALTLLQDIRDRARLIPLPEDAVS